MSLTAQRLPHPFITRVRVENYKSIAHCDVTLGRFTVLLGLNAAGKSNFLDALRFVRDALVDGPAEAVAARGGVREVFRRVPEPAASCTIRLEFHLPPGDDGEGPGEGEYKVTFAVGGAAHGGRGFLPEVRVEGEHCEVRRPGPRGSVDVHRLSASAPEGRPQKRLHLSQMGDTGPYAQLYAALTEMFFYYPDLAALRAASPNTPTAGALGENGRELGPALAALGDEERERVSQYIGAIVPGVVEVGPTDPSADYIAARIRFAADGESEPHVFRAESMSEGTIRAIGLLTALFQPDAREGFVPLVAVEEPELSLHPLAAGAVYDALTEASEHVQVLATTQSAELFDRKEADLSAIRVVVADHGQTVIGEVDPVSRSIVADGLATTAELLRSNQLRPVVDQQGSPSSSDQPEGEE